LRAAEIHTENRIEQLREPIENLKAEERKIQARFKPWEVGFGAYALMWLAYGGATFGILQQFEWNDLYVIPYLLSFLVPFLVPLVYNAVKRRREVDRPIQKLRRRIASLEREINPAVAQLDREYVAKKKKIEIELQELGILRDELAKID
jgi:hypothetical protein